MPHHQSPERDATSADAAGESDGRRILVVEDEPLIREILFEALTTCGYRVKTLGSAVEALEELGRSEYDLLLVDVRMPKMTGMEFFRRLGEDYPDMQSRVIFITGDVAAPSTQQFLDSANRPVLTKPFDLNLLRSVVAEGLRTARPGV